MRSLIDVMREFQPAIVGAWRGIARATGPIDETKARDAISRLAVAVTGREPRAILVFASPLEARIAAGYIRPEMLFRGRAGGLLTDVQRRLMQRLTPGVQEQADEIVRTVSSSAFGAPVAAAVEPAGWIVLDTSKSHPVWCSLMRQAMRVRPSNRFGIVRERRKREQVPRHIDLGLPGAMNTLLGLAAASQFVDLLGDRARLASAGDARLGRALRDACRETGSFWLYPDLAVIADRPKSIRRDGQGRLHASLGPAVEYRDGFAVYASHGVHIPAGVMEHPGRIGVQDIDTERNAEVRRVMLERMGVGRYLELTGAQRVAQDQTGVLWRRPAATARGRVRAMRAAPGPRQPICFVEVVNGTREPDGTRKRYFLRVPPDMQTAREAVAWTYGLTAEQYRPQVRT